MKTAEVTMATVSSATCSPCMPWRPPLISSSLAVKPTNGKKPAIEADATSARPAAMGMTVNKPESFSTFFSPVFFTTLPAMRKSDAL